MGDYNADGVDFLYFYDANDSFTVGGLPATIDEFEAALSRGDGLTVPTYAQADSLQSQFVLTADGPLAPASVTATAGTGQSSNDITVVIDPDQPTLPALYDSFGSQRKVSTQPDSAYTTVKTLTPAEDADTSTTTITYVDQDVAAGTYTYRAAGVIDADQGPFTASTNATSVAPGPDATAPLSNDAVVTTNSGLGNTFGGGDVFKVVFNEALAVPTAGDTIRAEDGDNTVGDFVNGTNAAFTLNAAAETVNGVSRPAGTVLTVTLSGAPTIVTAGTVVGLQIPATVTDQAGNTDTAGNGWNIAGSPDVFLDQDADDNNATGTGNAPVAQSANFTDEATDGDTIFGDEAGDTLTVTFNENVTVGAGDTVTVSPDGGTTTLVYTCGTDVVCTGSGIPTITLTSDGTTPDATFDGTSDQVTDSNGVVDGDNNEAIGFPVAIA